MFLVSVAFFVLFISTPLQVIFSYNQRDRIPDVKFWYLFPKRLPSIFIVQEVPSKKRHRIKIKPLFLLTFVTRYSNSEVNKSRTFIKRYATISSFIFHVEAVISLKFFLIYVTLPLGLGNIWYFCIRLLISNLLFKECTVPNKKYTNDVLCVTKKKKKKYISQNNNSVTTSSVLNNIQCFTNNIIWTNKIKNKTNKYYLQ